MEVVVDDGRCQGHGKCYLLVSEVFEPKDDYGHARVRRMVDADDSELKRRVEIAIANCPERAILWKGNE
jgi:ferredoxin